MSNHAAVMLQLRTACQHCFLRQLELVSEVGQLSKPLKATTGELFVRLHQIEDMNGNLDASPEQQAKLATISAVVESAANLEEFNKLRLDLLDLMRELCGISPGLETSLPERLPISSHEINKRVVNQLFDVPLLIRNSRVRINSNGGSYDKTAYATARNRVKLAAHVYRQQLSNDAVIATNEEAAQLEKTYCKDIREATAANFVARLEALAAFISARITA